MGRDVEKCIENLVDNFSHAVENVTVFGENRKFFCKFFVKNKSHFFYSRL